jgi:hypothetical protein
MINTKLQNIIDTKAAIGNAINNKGGSITAETPFYEYAPAIENISSGGGAYSTWVVEDEVGAKYQVHNGYDQITNPTPNLSNIPFNQWLLNNSATNEIVLSNVVLEQTTYNSPNTIINQANMAFVDNSPSFGGAVFAMAINNGFIYAIGDGDGTIKKYHESNLGFVGNTVNMGAGGNGIVIHNGRIYASRPNLNIVQTFNESTLNRAGNSASFGTGSCIATLRTDNDLFLYAGIRGSTANIRIVRVLLSNLGLLTNIVVGAANTNEKRFEIKDSYIYTSPDASPYRIQAYSAYTNAVVINSADIPNFLDQLGVNNGFVYGLKSGELQKYNQNNLTFVENVAVTSFGSNVANLSNIAFNGGFVYILSNSSGAIRKYYENNLTYVGAFEVGGAGRAFAINNGYIYTGKDDGLIRRFKENQIDNLGTYYTISSIKE